MGPTSRSRTDGPRRGQPGEELAYRRAAERIAPTRRDLGEGAKHEIAGAKGGVGDGRPRAVPGTAGPEDDVEIEHARPPAAARTAAEGALDPLELGEQSGRIETALDDRGAIGEAAPRRTERR